MIKPVKIEVLRNVLSDEEFDGIIWPTESMRAHTTYRIGGEASFFVVCDSVKSLQDLLKACKTCNISWFICGRGSNLLVADSGFKGIVIMLGRDFKQYELDKENSVYSVGAGVSLSRIVNEAFRNSFSGMEFAVGTPGTIGGAVHMDAGSRDEWIGQRIKSVKILDENLDVVTKAGSDIDWGYRTTSLSDEEVILGCELQVQKVNSKEEKAEIRRVMDKKLAARRASQPVNCATCGSVFRNPEGESAGRLIELAGLKGAECGGAQISEKHANFIVNTGHAEARDVVALIQAAQRRVFELFGHELKPEVKFVGFKEECSLF